VPDNAPEDTTIRRAAEIETRIALTNLTCPDCGGVFWKIGNELPLRYRCHTGDAFSAVSLEDRQRQQSEDALWSLVRGLPERISLAKQLLASSERDRLEELTARVKRLGDAEERVLDIVKWNERPHPQRSGT
jgi:two-component system chemotaxis response regulator CheB